MPTESATHALVDRIDDRFLVQTLVELAQVPTEVPLGKKHLHGPRRPQAGAVCAARVCVRASSLWGRTTLSTHQATSWWCAWVDGSADPCFLLMVYTPTQHHNLMEDPFSGKIARASEWGLRTNPASLGRE